MSYVRSDLAIEAHENSAKDSAINGINIDEQKFDYGIKISDVKVKTLQAGKVIGKPMGRYITLDASGADISDIKAQKKVVDVLSTQIEELIKDYKDDGVLVVGLGNRSITPDALGPSVCEHVFISRHLKVYMPDLVDAKACEVSAIAPGVLGITGLETFEVIKGIVDKIKPGVVIAIDSLSSRKLSRVSTTYQLTDSGISPGSGIGNKRKAINEKELGVPVVAIGVPMVVYAATIASDLIEQMLLKDNDYDDDQMQEAIKTYMEKIMDVDGGDMIVTPKEIDIIVERCANIIAAAINIVVSNGAEIDEIDKVLH